jgi:DNA-binding transcriptional MerR regulator
MTVKLPIADAATESLDDARLIRVGDLAQLTSKTVRALHLYEELGLLHPSERSKGGYRLYGTDATLRVRWISKLQDMGFSLPAIREILTEWEASGSASGAMHRVRELYAQKLDETRAQIARLTALQTELQGTIGYLDTCETCDPERLVHSCTRCDLHECGPPELVAGLHGRKH